MFKNQQWWQDYFPQFIDHADHAVLALMESSNLVSIPAGQQLFYPGDRCENYLLLLEGRVKIQLMSENGREVLLYQVHSGDSCVLTTSCLISGDSYPAEGITETDVTAFTISAPAFHRGIEQSAFFREFVFKNFSARLAKLITRMESVVFGSIDQRLATLLLASNRQLISKTHQELAYELGTAREVVSRHLKHFEKHGWVNLSRGTVEITDRPAIQGLCANQDS
ncbi:MAG: Crp/Fnr family transcriptional regulator [Methylococcales bacterium]